MKLEGGEAACREALDTAAAADTSRAVGTGGLDYGAQADAGSRETRPLLWFSLCFEGQDAGPRDLLAAPTPEHRIRRRLPEHATRGPDLGHSSSPSFPGRPPEDFQIHFFGERRPFPQK